MQKLFISNLAPDISKNDLLNLFFKYGEVLELNIIKDAITGENKNFGFVIFENEYDADLALEELNNTDFHGYNLEITKAKEEKIEE